MKLKKKKEQRPRSINTDGELVGRRARSLCGRDAENVMLIVGEDGDYVFLADGKIRKISSPKPKRKKHVLLLPGDGTEAAKLIRGGADDSVLRSLLCNTEE